MPNRPTPESIAKRLTPGQRDALLWLSAPAHEWRGHASVGTGRALASMSRMATPLVIQGERTKGKIRTVPYALTDLGAEVRSTLLVQAWDEELRPEPQPWYRRIGGMRFFRFGRLQITTCWLNGGGR